MSALRGLNSEWREWVKVCLLKQIPTNVIADELIKRKWFDAAIELMDKNKNISIPYINVLKNSVQLKSKEVSIVTVKFNPFIVVLDNFLSAKECEKLINGSKDKLQRAKVINDLDGSRVESDQRKSRSMNYQHREDGIVRIVEERIAEITNWPVENGEQLVVLEYEKGGEYKPHYDYFNPNEAGSSKVMQKSGQRLGTFLIYLSEVEEGGATRFPELGFEVRPKVGRALYFCNVDFNGKIDSNTLHAGTPVTTGVKYLATKWIREKPYV